ncbi:hypothetical protein Tco_1212905 [Tanacetum coccineum]
MNQNFNSFSFDHIQPPQQFDNHRHQEILEVTPFVECKEWIETNNELYKMMEDFTKRMNQELRKQEVLLAPQREQELLAQKQAAQENQVSLPNFVFRQLIEEMCGTKVCEEKKQNMEDTMLDLLKICQQKELYCIYNNAEDLIESALNSKLLLINLNSQRLNKEEQEVKNIAKPTAKRQTRITSCLQNFKVISKESTIPLNKIPQISPVNANTHNLPIKEPEDSLIMGNEQLSTIPEKESDQFIKSSVEDLIPILRESEDSSGSDSESVLPSSDDLSPIVEEKSMTFSNPLFEFDDEYISNDVNPLFDEVLENIESKESYVSNLDMDFSTDIENGYHDSKGDIIYLESLLIDDTSPNLPPEVFLDHDPRSLKDEHDNDDLMTEDKVFDPVISVRQSSSSRDSISYFFLYKEESFKKKDMSIEEIMSEKQLIDDEIKDITNDLSYKRFRGEKIDDEYERDCEIKINQLLQDYNGLDIEMRKKERVLMEEKYLAASQRIKSICKNEDDSIPLRDIIARYSPVEDLVPIPRESEDTSGSDSENVLHSCDDFSPISIFEEKLVTFSNPLFNSNDEFTSSDDESLSDEDVPEVKELEDIECKVSYDSNLDESTFLVTPLSDSNEDEVFTPRDDVELLLHHDPSISIVSILEGFIDEPPLEENDDLFDLESKGNDWKKILYDAPIDDLITEDKVFDPGIYEKSFSPTFVKLTFEDRHYFPITFVIRIFLPYLTYSVDSLFLLSPGSKDTIFYPSISTFHFSSLKPVAYENPMVIFPFFCFCPKDKGIRGESS